MARHSLSHGLRTWLAVVGGFSSQSKVSVPGRQVCFWARLCDDRLLVVSLFGQPSLAQTGAVADVLPGRGCSSGCGAWSRARLGIGSSP